MRLGVHHRHVVHAQYHILGGTDDGFAVGGLEQVLGSQHQAAGLLHSPIRQRHMHSHLVAIEVGIEGGTNQRV